QKPRQCHSPLFLNLFRLIVCDEHALLVPRACPYKHELPTVRALLLPARHLIEMLIAVRADGIGITNRFVLQSGYPPLPALSCDAATDTQPASSATAHGMVMP
ncbi:MAG: hypothetical protein KAY37_08575, partial [Phycisphaerae bacterium]|nr:hypothetical protein [Phycisphaerae bacterium]